MQTSIVSEIWPAIVLSIFRLSFMFVIVCVLFQWKRICARFLFFVFFLFVFFYCLLYLYFRWWWRSNYREGGVGIQLTGLTAPHFCACPKPVPVVQTWSFVFVFNELRWEEFVDHHYLNFLFINTWCWQRLSASPKNSSLICWLVYDTLSLSTIFSYIVEDIVKNTKKKNPSISAIF